MHEGPWLHVVLNVEKLINVNIKEHGVIKIQNTIRNGVIKIQNIIKNIV